MQVNNGLTNTEVKAIAANDTLVFAGTDEGIFLSSDYGSSWSEINALSSVGGVNSIAISGNYIFAGTGMGVLFINQ